MEGTYVVSIPEKPWAGMPCEICGETITADDDGQTIGIVDDTGGRQGAIHPECIALGLIGHTWGVCRCTGFAHDRAAALELKRRMHL